MIVSFAYRFNLYKAANEYVSDELKATSALFGDDLEFLNESKAAVDEWVKTNIKLIKDVDKYKRVFSGKTIAFFGDSLTSDKLGYRNLIENSGIFKNVLDFSISGSNSTDCFKIVSRKAQAKLADVAVIFIGTNDVMEFNGVPLIDDKTYYRNMFNMVEILKNNEIDIKLIKVPFTEFENMNRSIIRINETINLLSRNFNIDVFDANELLLDKSCHEPDGVHLLPEFHVSLCNEFLKWLCKTC